MNRDNLKSGECILTGKAQGKYNDGNWEVKRGVTKNGKKYQVFSIQVNSKNQDGTWTNGKGIDVMMFGEVKVDHGDIVGLVGRFQPNNYEKDGKTTYGNQFMCNAEDMFTPEAWEKKTETKKVEPKKDDEPLDDVW